jgi:hypothetical protein
MQLINIQHVEISRKKTCPPPDWLATLQQDEHGPRHIGLEAYGLTVYAPAIEQTSKENSYSALTHSKENALDAKRAMYYQNKKQAHRQIFAAGSDVVTLDGIYTPTLGKEWTY